MGRVGNGDGDSDGSGGGDGDGDHSRDALDDLGGDNDGGNGDASACRLSSSMRRVDATRAGNGPPDMAAVAPTDGGLLRRCGVRTVGATPIPLTTAPPSIDRGRPRRRVDGRAASAAAVAAAPAAKSSVTTATVVGRVVAVGGGGGGRGCCDAAAAVARAAGSRRHGVAG